MRAVVASLLVVAGLWAPALAGGHPTQPFDNDHDGVMNTEDVCPDVFDARQTDTDGDGQGDACDADDDRDGVDDAVDNCGLLENPDQRDTDSDGEGDLCDEDDDADGVRDRDDACPKVADPDQADHDDDFVGDACDPDAPKVRERSFVELGRRDPADKTPPVVRVRVDRRVTAAQARAGVPVEVRCSEACAVTAALRSGRRVLGRADSAVARAGTTFLFPRARRRSGTLTLALEIRDASGNRVTRTRRVRVVAR